MARKSDLFSSLYCWAYHQGENFTTDAFVFLLRELQDREPTLYRSFLGWLCFKDESFAAFGHSMPSIDTRRPTEEGIPDILVENEDVFVLIEVKKGSDLHTGQLRQYHSELKRHPQKLTRLVLLTAFQATFSEDEKPNNCVRWSEVATWFCKNAPSDVVATWLVNEFLNFLQGQVMTIEKVEWQYIEGAKALYNLTTMLGKAFEDAGVPLYRGSAAWDHRGHYTKDKQFWAGIYMNSPEVLRFQFDSAKPDVEKLKMHGWEFCDDRYATSLNLASESAHFFARTKDSQLDLLTTFVRNAYQTACQCVATT